MPHLRSVDRAFVVFAALFTFGVLIAFSNMGVRMLLSGSLLTPESADERWFIITQSGDCEASRNRAQLHAKFRGWSRPPSVQYLLPRNGELPAASEVGAIRMGTVRSNLLLRGLQLRGFRSTPVLIRIAKKSSTIDIISLNDPPTRNLP